MMGEPNFPTIESVDHKLKNEINLKLALLLRKGIHLADIVDLLDAKEFLTYVQTKKGQAPVAHFSVDNFVKKRIGENRKISLPDDYTKLDEVILPPSEMEITTGSGNGFKEAGVIPRSALLMETLAELELKYSVVEGENNPKMMRKLSYLIFILPSIEKLVLVNNEEGNATFIVHKAKQEEWKDYMQKTKEELSAMPYDLVSVVRYPDKNREGHANKWKTEIKSLVANGPEESEESKRNEKTYIPENWMPLMKVRIELGVSFPTIHKYIKEYEKVHPEWFKYGKPRGIYFSPELVGLLKKERIERAVPEGWLSLFASAKELNIAPLTVQKQAERFRQEHPDWFKTFINIQGKDIEHYSPELLKVLIENNASMIVAPEDWLTLDDLVHKIGTGAARIKREAENYRLESHYIKNFKTKKMGVPREHYSPELVQMLMDKFGIKSTSDAEKKILPKDIESAPEGWQTASALSRIVGAAGETVKEFAESYRAEHPNWFETRKNPQYGMMAEHYHPELVKTIHEEFEKNRPKSGWLTPYALAGKIGVDGKTIYKYAENYRSEHPDWFVDYKDKRGIMREHYSPELFSILENTLKRTEKFEEAPGGWLTQSSAIKEIGLTWMGIKKIVDVYRVDHPEWFKVYEDMKGLPREYYHPELVEKIHKDKEKGYAPVGWMSAYHLAKTIGVATGTVQDYVEEYRTQYPGWFKSYLHETRRRHIEYFSPELCKILTERYGKYEPAPEGWSTFSGLARDIGVDNYIVRNHAEKYRAGHSGWFKILKTSRGLVKEHYSPELVEIIKEKCKRIYKVRRSN